MNHLQALGRHNVGTDQPSGEIPRLKNLIGPCGMDFEMGKLVADAS
ncbi:MAG: hypothetical protein P4L64_00260 [Caulobacteraceae bacterium]|nr:hypothetical protein [Caulobacteraceae bacterium]